MHDAQGIRGQAAGSAATPARAVPGSLAPSKGHGPNTTRPNEMGIDPNWPASAAAHSDHVSLWFFEQVAELLGRHDGLRDRRSLPGDPLERVGALEHPDRFLAVPPVANTRLLQRGKGRHLLLERLDCGGVVVVAKVEG